MAKHALKRQALTKPNLSYLRWRFVANASRTLRAWLSRADDDQVARVASELRERGIVIGPAEQYLTDAGRTALADASAKVLEISRNGEVTNGQVKDKKDYLVRLIPWEHKHSADSPLLKLALNPRLLQIVAGYLDLWPRLHAVGAWLNLPTDNHPKEAQLWHRDPEDMKIIKVFIYLNDVGEENGPFCYIPKTHPFATGAGIVPQHKDKKRILDDEMVQAIPMESWVMCTGPAHTMIMADTVGYHRGGKPKVGNRILITFTYTSGTPFVKRVLRVAGEPTWMTHDIQRHAL